MLFDVYEFHVLIHSKLYVYMDTLVVGLFFSTYISDEGF